MTLPVVFSKATIDAPADLPTLTTSFSPSTRGDIDDAQGRFFASNFFNVFLLHTTLPEAAPRQNRFSRASKT